MRRCLPAAPPVEPWHGGPCPCRGGSASPGETPARPPSALRQSSAAACRPGVRWTRCLLSTRFCRGTGEGQKGSGARQDCRSDLCGTYAGSPEPGSHEKAPSTPDQIGSMACCNSVDSPCCSSVGSPKMSTPRALACMSPQSLLLSMCCELKVNVCACTPQRTDRQ